MFYTLKEMICFCYIFNRRVETIRVL